MPTATHAAEALGAQLAVVAHPNLEPALARERVGLLASQAGVLVDDGVFARSRASRVGASRSTTPLAAPRTRVGQLVDNERDRRSASSGFGEWLTLNE